MSLKAAFLHFFPPPREQIDDQVLAVMSVGEPLTAFGGLRPRLPSYLRGWRMWVALDRLEDQGRIYRTDAKRFPGRPDLTIQATYTRLQ